MRNQLFLLIAFLGFSIQLKAQEQVSTWSFADKIGWKGLQVNVGGAAVCQT